MAERYEPPRSGKAFLDRVGGKPASDLPDTEASVPESFGGSRNSEDDLMLDIRLKDGTRCALAYVSLAKVDYYPADRLKLVFATVTVVIEGRRLLSLYELLRRHRARYVQEGTLAEEGLKPDEASHIETIHFEDPEEDTL